MSINPPIQKAFAVDTQSHSALIGSRHTLPMPALITHRDPRPSGRRRHPRVSRIDADHAAGGAIDPVEWALLRSVLNQISALARPWTGARNYSSAWAAGRASAAPRADETGAPVRPSSAG